MCMINQFVIVSGLSGSGKSTALNALEDMGFYAIDNLPIQLLEKLTQLFLAGPSDIQKIAIVMDLRDSAFIKHFPEAFRQVRRDFPKAEILYIEASDEVMTRRFSETRRKHPLSTQSVAEGIARERRLLSDLKDFATTIIDSSDMTVHDLKQRINDQFSGTSPLGMQIQFTSFGFKYGIPPNCDLLFDVRFLHNPHFVSELRDLTGLDKPVQDYILNDSRTTAFIEKTTEYLRFLIPEYAKEGKTYLSIGIGCTGGKHRSVFLTQTLAERLQDQPHRITALHQHLRFYATKS
jgi:RNase adapter protein RapZ